MAYFSNHSAQSRFPTTTAAAQSPTATAGSIRPRVPSSRHFSTSLSGSSEERSSSGEKSKPPQAGVSVSSSDENAEVHPLRNTYVRTLARKECRVLTDMSDRWVSWFRQQRAPGNKITNYEEGIKKISAFSSVST